VNYDNEIVCVPTLLYRIQVETSKEYNAQL